MVEILKDDFGKRLKRPEVNIRVYTLWKDYRCSQCEGNHISVLYKEGRRVLSSFCHPKVLGLRGLEAEERGISSKLADVLVIRFGLTETAGSWRRFKDKPSPRFVYSLAPSTREPEAEDRYTSSTNEQRGVRSGTTPG